MGKEVAPQPARGGDQQFMSDGLGRAPTSNPRLGAGCQMIFFKYSGTDSCLRFDGPFPIGYGPNFLFTPRFESDGLSG